MNKKLTVILIAQTILILILFWIVIYYGKDEYEAYRASKGDDIESLSHVTSANGVNMIKLSPETQKNSGIQTDHPLAANYKGNLKSSGSVISVDGLIETKAKYLALASEIATARATYTQQQKQSQRLKDLNADDKNVSDQALQEAEATSNAALARVQSAELQLRNLQSTVNLQWGPALGKLVFEDKLPPALQGLIDRKSVLIQISLPVDSNPPLTGSTLTIAPLNDGSHPIHAVYLSPAAQADPGAYGKTFYYVAPAETLRIGMRVNAEFAAPGHMNSGVIIPSKAIVWYAGKPWVYVKSGNDTFVRKPVSAETETAEGWFNQGMSVKEEIVISGAQLLLSEEFKYQIKNENED
jgi:hypothetical protein